jgi:hypothetical protein
MDALARITHDTKLMGGRPCFRGLRATVGTILGLPTDAVMKSPHPLTEKQRKEGRKARSQIRARLKAITEKWKA